jgi:hypothetical protein
MVRFFLIFISEMTPEAAGNDPAFTMAHSKAPKRVVASFGGLV